MIGRPWILLAPLLLVAACSSPADPAAPDSAACGWDLTTQAGRDANAEWLTFMSQWLVDNPGITPPEPTSSYWHGECPTSAVPLPPEGEDEAPAD